ncbi:hypothetical protein BV25DRAFT_1314589 [Artomyces pyxidatus]|uniref:Uncharacterized protein n=1 Tax=Artomyces pyxidatus TaxID=48021 RepID=A0ACB8SPG3_9AGAM|nr:hypothetical protein BV25DRAFT_1314589 [Artomyces pyxidatus]
MRHARGKEITRAFVIEDLIVERSVPMVLQVLWTLPWFAINQPLPHPSKHCEKHRSRHCTVLPANPHRRVIPPSILLGLKKYPPSSQPAPAPRTNQLGTLSDPFSPTSLSSKHSKETPSPICSTIPCENSQAIAGNSAASITTTRLTKQAWSACVSLKTKTTQLCSNCLYGCAVPQRRSADTTFTHLEHHVFFNNVSLSSIISPGWPTIVSTVNTLIEYRFAARR